jgi:predicted kinase
MANLIVFMGAPGVGKTHLIKGLQNKNGIYFFDRDLMYDAIFSDDRESDAYKTINGPITKSIWDLAIANARNGASSILESPMTPAIRGEPASFIDDVLKAAQESDFRMSLIYCVAPEEVVLARLQERGLPEISQNTITGKVLFKHLLMFPDQHMSILG